MKKIITLLFTLLSIPLVYSQILEVDLETKFYEADFIFQGRIIDQYSFKTEKSIYTDYTLEIEDIIKGNENSQTIKIKSIGGRVDNEMLITNPQNNFVQNSKAIYFLKNIGSNIYEPYYFGQSIISEYDTEYESAQELIKELDKRGEKKGLEKNNSFQQRSPQATITDITPLEVTAGIGETITITGSDFGTTGPSTDVQVWTRFADSPTQMVSYPNSYSYVSWSDTQIVFKVSSNAGSGQIWVGSASSHATSSQSISVITNIRDNATANGANILPISLPPLQEQGIQFIPNTNFTNPDAIARTQEAMSQWQCESNIDMSLDTTTSTPNLNNTNDGLSVIYFDSSLNASVLGVTLTTLTACSTSGRWYVTNTDLAINGNTNFNFTLANTTSSQMDFYSVILHELGHVRNLGHVLNSGQIMYPSITTGQQIRTLHPNDIIGGLWVQNDSNSNQVCGNSLMVDGDCTPLGNYDYAISKTSIYPNPADTQINVKYNSNQVYTYEIFDVLGKKINSGILLDSMIPISNLRKGLYLLILKGDHSLETFKIIKQ